MSKKKTTTTNTATTTTENAPVDSPNPAINENTETPETPDTTSDEIIEVEWDEVKHIHDFKNRVSDLESYFSNMCLTYEKNKANLMSQIVYGQNDLFALAQNLQKSKNIDESLTYELKLPSQPGEKGYFVRKDD